VATALGAPPTYAKALRPAAVFMGDSGQMTPFSPCNRITQGPHATGWQAPSFTHTCIEVQRSKVAFKVIPGLAPFSQAMGLTLW